MFFHDISYVPAQFPILFMEEPDPLPGPFAIGEPQPGPSTIKEPQPGPSKRKRLK